MNRELLEKPFDANQIKQRKGNFGKKLDYIEGHAVIQRLNDAFDGEWSFRITSHEVIKETDEVVVLVELTASDIVKAQFGSSKIKRAKETGEIISLADDLKAAATDALKKSATLLGIGLQLYNDRVNSEQPPQSMQRKIDVGFDPVQGHSNLYKPTFSTNENAPNPNNGDDNIKNRNQLSIKQFAYIRSLGRKNYGYSLEDLSSKTLKIFGVEVHALSTAEASNFIDLLQSGDIRSAAAV